MLDERGSLLLKDVEPDTEYREGSFLRSTNLFKKAQNTWLFTFEEKPYKRASEILASYEFKGYDTIIKLEWYTYSTKTDHLAEFLVKKNGQFGIINHKEEALIPLIYDTILHQDYGYIKAIKNGLYGLYYRWGYKLVKAPIFKKVFDDSRI